MLKKVSLLAAVAVLTALLWKIHLQDREIVALTSAAKAQGPKDRTDIPRQEATQPEPARARPELQMKADPPDATAVESALEAWFAKIAKLSAYLEEHPERRIPQMDALTATEWLDVTKDGDFASEADFREALGKLRGLARKKFAPDIGKALSAAILANGGELPTDPQALLPFLPPGFDPQILQQVKTNPSGQVPGLKELGRDASGRLVTVPTKYFLVDVPVDIWDATLFYKNDGGFGTRSASAPGESTVAKAMAEYAQSVGRPPTTALQLKPYAGIEALDPSVLDELFAALSNRPNL